MMFLQSRCSLFSVISSHPVHGCSGCIDPVQGVDVVFFREIGRFLSQAALSINHEVLVIILWCEAVAGYKLRVSHKTPSAEQVLDLMGDN